MANPNIRNLTVLTGHTVVANVTTTFATLLTNNAGSNQIFKLVNVTASNITDTNNMWVTVNLVRSLVGYAIARNIVVPMSSSLLILGKDSPVYVMEGDSIQVRAGANSNIQLICSYEVIQ